MTIFKKENQKLFHIHIPKTGGTSLVNEMKELGWKISLFDKADSSVHYNVPPQHMTKEQYTNFVDVKNIPNFAIVRDPWERTVSEFVWREKTNNFQKINEWFNKMLDELKSKTLQNHFAPQKDFIHESTKVFRYKDYNSLIEFINKFEPNYRNVMRANKISLYVLPKQQDVFSKTTIDKWLELYRDDQILFDNIKQNKK